MNSEFRGARSAPAEQLPPELLLPMLHDADDMLVLAEAPGSGSNAVVIVYVNRGFTKLTGYSQQEAIGQGLSLLGGMDADLRRHVEETPRGGRPGRMEFLIQAKSGRKKWIEVDTISLRNGRRKPTHLAVIGRDITEKKAREEALSRAEERDISNRAASERKAREAETRLRNAIERVNEGFILFDAHDRVVLSNSRFREIYAWGEVVEPGLTCEELAERLGEYMTHSLDGESDGMWIREQVALWRSPDATVIEQQLPSGRWVRASSHRTREGGLVSVHTDITGHMQRERALLAAKEEAESANRAKSEFLANTSHELRTPLNAIIGFSEIMGRQMIGPVGEPRYLEYARDIYESGTHLLDLINTILDTAKIEAEKYHFEESPVDLYEVIDACLRQMAPQIETSKLEVSRQIESNFPSLLADKRAFTQVLLNLLSNAAKFTNRGGRIVVSAYMDDCGAVVSVADNGIGIAQADLDRIFKPFEQVENSQSRTRPGTGLGLSITRSLVEMHAGELGIDSRPGEGTTITVRLPKSRLLISAA